MSAKYSEMQAVLTERSSLALFVPCCGRSLNLVVQAAANSCPSRITVFDFVPHIYVFFMAITKRYEILIKTFSEAGTKFYMPKNLSQTRWSCRADATKVIARRYENINSVLHEI
jgi:hypothetical protein